VDKYSKAAEFTKRAPEHVGPAAQIQMITPEYQLADSEYLGRLWRLDEPGI
jgi:hypothetical protein